MTRNKTAAWTWLGMALLLVLSQAWALRGIHVPNDLLPSVVVPPKGLGSHVVMDALAALGAPELRIAASLLALLASSTLVFLLVLHLGPDGRTDARMPFLAAICGGFLAAHPLVTEALHLGRFAPDLMSLPFALVSVLALLLSLQGRSTSFGWQAASWLSFAAVLMLGGPAPAVLSFLMAAFVWKSRCLGLPFRRLWLAPAVYGIMLVVALLAGSMGRLGTPDPAALTGPGLPALATAFWKTLLLAAIPLGQSVVHPLQAGWLPAAALLVLAVLTGVLTRLRPARILVAAGLFLCALHAGDAGLDGVTLSREGGSLFLLAAVAVTLGAVLARPPQSDGMVAALCVLVFLFGVKSAWRHDVWTSASSVWADAARTVPANPVVLGEQGLALLQEGKPSEACTWLETALQIASSGRASLPPSLASKYSSTLAETTASLAAEKDSPELLRIHEVARQGRIADAALLYARYIDSHPRNLSARKALADCLMRLHHFPEATVELRLLLAALPDDGLLHGKLAYCYTQQSQFNLARQHYRKAIEINPMDSVSLANIGLLEMRQKNYPLAAVYFEKAIEVNPGIADFHYNLAVCYAATGRPREARREAAAALALRPDDAAAKKLIQTLRP